MSRGTHRRYEDVRGVQTVRTLSNKVPVSFSGRSHGRISFLGNPTLLPFLATWSRPHFMPKQQPPVLDLVRIISFYGYLLHMTYSFLFQLTSFTCYLLIVVFRWTSQQRCIKLRSLPLYWSLPCSFILNGDFPLFFDLKSGSNFGLLV